MPTDRDKPYDVGYGRPPEGKRFRKGESGNPKGRPRGSKNIATLLDEELSERVPVNENGKRKTITMRKAITKQTVRKAASGNEKFIKQVFELDGLKDARDGSVPSATAPTDDDDRQVIQDLRRQLAAEGGHEDEGSKSS
jgi:Family of unknown function (DUF5681)